MDRFEAILEAAKDAGADAASYIMLRLPLEVSPLWQDWLDTHYLNRATRVMGLLRDMHGGKDYEAAWGKRMRGEGSYADLIAQRFALATKRLGLAVKTPPLRKGLFRPPTRAGDQLSLF